MYSIYYSVVLALLASLPCFGQRIEKSGANDSIHWKNYSLHNNQWGLYKIKKGAYSQKIYKDQNIVGWDWQAPTKSYGVIGYPMLQIGVNPWTKLEDVPSANAFYDVTAIRKFDVNYATELKTTRLKYNLSFDFWLHTSEKVAFETIGAEVMIWEDYQKFKPFGKKKGSIVTSFGSYDVYVGSLYKKELQKGWKYIAFVRQQPRTSGQLNVMEFIHYLKNNSLLQDAKYLSSFEFGTEVLNASGSIKIIKYDVEIQ